MNASANKKNDCQNLHPMKNILYAVMEGIDCFSYELM